MSEGHHNVKVGSLCHDPRNRDNHFSPSQVYSNFVNYMCRTFSLSPLYYINYTLFFCCYGHVTCNQVCFVTCWMTDHSHTIPLLGIVNACINIVTVEYINRASSWPYSQNLTSCLVPQSLYPSTRPSCCSCWRLPRLLSQSAYTFSLWPASLSSKPIHPLNPPRVVLLLPSGL
jgi:hypothetical protein